MNFMLHHCHPVYMCLYNLLSCIFDSYSSNLGKMQIQMVSIGATKNHIARCNKNGNWKARPDRDVGLSEFLAFCSVKNCHTFCFLIQNDKYLSWIPLHEHFCELYSTCWESWKESSPFNGGASILPKPPHTLEIACMNRHLCWIPVILTFSQDKA